MRISPEFPDDRRRDPMRRAELRVYRRLAASEVAGRALYQVRASKRDRELDFLVFLEGLARIGIEVKGGSYRLRGGGWQLRTTDGWQWKPSPADQLSAAMGSVQDTLAVCLGRRVPVIPVLAFPDMKADEDIEALARADGVKVVWGPGRLVDHLVALGEASGLMDVPTADGVETEVAAVTSGEAAGLPPGRYSTWRACRVRHRRFVPGGPDPAGVPRAPDTGPRINLGSTADRTRAAPGVSLAPVPRG